ncbi:5-methylthioadenosine/S-adenosylhomocysteine deaminase [Rhodococcus triatomae]|uniref:5-methylthioadenosine/S-adenosylhomocysteine deaminase n=2 Tax=Rhodococcus triatomae TaxID=300028 RepID=A0A1G8BE08_9NOCA|nr:5-methylthioadenosine/S-adenosylhomocysteine deaminase [Rhodococcus triatomae]
MDTFPITRPGPVRRVRDVTVYAAGQWVPHRDVLVADGTIVEIAPADLEPRDGDLDGSGGHLIPGFVNTHTHLQQSVMRGIGEGQPLLNWLLTVGEETAAITPERAYLAAVAGSLDALRSGTTALVEHMWPHPSEEVHAAVLRALDDTGVRALLGRGVADRPDASRKWGMDPRLLQPLGEILEHTERLATAARGTRVQVGLAVPNPRCLTPEGMTAVREFAQHRAMTVSIHLLETTTDDTMCREHAGRGAVDHLDAHGFLWDRVLAVHCCELDAHGRELLARRGVAVSYNPMSNMRLGSGVAPIPEMLEAGIDVGLGVDGAASNDTQDMLETLRIGSYVQRALHRKADLFGFDTMMSLATDGANTTLGMAPRPGGVAVGDPADLTLIRFERDFGCLPVRDPGASLLTTGSRQIVDTVLVAGEPVIRDGRSTRIDETALVSRLSDLAPGVLAGVHG